jgi:radical SAM superfamily enzyme YgiQ (UPF0313 family)
MEMNGHNVQSAYINENDNIESICSVHPDLIGMNVFHDDIDQAIALLERCKQSFTHAHVCLGGHYASFYAEQIMRRYAIVDFIVISEGEETFKILCDTLVMGKALSNVDGLVYRENSLIVLNQNRQLISDLSKLPLYSTVLLSYKKMNKFATIEGSRGCTSNCAFCSQRAFWLDPKRSNWRPYPINRIVDDIERIYGMGIQKFSFTDGSLDEPHGSVERMEGLADEILKRNLSVAYQFNLKAGIYSRFEQVATKLIQSGCAGVFLGIESFTKNDLKLFQKSSTVDINILAVRSFLQLDLFTVIGLINIHPYATISSIMSNMKQIEAFHLGGEFLFLRDLYIYKGTSIYEKTISDGLFSDDNRPNEYEYVDENIKTLHSFTKRILSNSAVYMKYIAPINAFCREYLQSLYYLKRLLQKRGKRREMDFIEDELMRVKELSIQLSEKAVRWFYELLEEIQRKSSQENLSEFTARYFHENCNGIQEELGTVKKNVFKQIIKFDPSNVCYF